MSLKTLGGRTFAALTFGALTLHGVSTGPIPPTPPPVVWTMQGGPGGQGGKRWVEEAYEVDKARAVAKALAENEDEEAVILAIITEVAQQYYM